MFVQLRPFKNTRGILLEGKIGFIDKYVTILNIYASYKNRDSFWASLSDSGLLNVDNLIITGDLNFTTSSVEIWGKKCKT